MYFTSSQHFLFWIWFENQLPEVLKESQCIIPYVIWMATSVFTLAHLPVTSKTGFGQVKIMK